MRLWHLRTCVLVWRQIMFETFEVPSLFVAGSAVLTLYNGGRETGLVVSSGESFTDVVPIYESVVMTHAVQRLHVAGAALTDRLRTLLLESGAPAAALDKPGTVQSVKEAVWYVLQRYESHAVPARLHRGVVLRRRPQLLRCGCRN